jgi:hypothetical protein
MSGYTHLIAVDPTSGMLWGGVPIAAGWTGLELEVDNNTPLADGVQVGDLWDACTVYQVVLSDDAEEAPAGAPDGARCVYRGHDLGWLPDMAKAAWGERA